jgi:hypothetical protein
MSSGFPDRWTCAMGCAIHVVGTLPLLGYYYRKEGITWIT